MLTRDEIRKYLDRLEYDKIPAPDLETLHALQWAHLTHVPYENIDALLGIPISLKPDDLYRKIVLEHRGGWCFELQGAYGYLLQSLGFAVMQYAARFMDEPGVVQMRRHRILVVDFNGRRYLTDVGVRSESPRKPLALVFDAIQSDGVLQLPVPQGRFLRLDALAGGKGQAMEADLRLYGRAADRRRLRHALVLGRKASGLDLQQIPENIDLLRRDQPHTRRQRLQRIPRRQSAGAAGA